MRLGVIAAIVFMVLSFGLLFGSIENRPLIDPAVQENMETMMTVNKVTQQGSFGVGSVVTLVSAVGGYFDSLVQIAWTAFNNPLVQAGGYWAIIPYFGISPLMIVLFFGLIILLIGILSKSFS